MEIIQEIQNYGIKHSDPEIVKKYSRYFKEAYDAYGLTDQKVKSLVAMLFEKYAITQNDVFILGNILFKSGKYEEGSVAILLLKHFEKEFDTQTIMGISKWFENGVNNWAHCDGICMYLLRPLVINKIVSINDLNWWLTAEYRFQRRAAAVAMLEFMKIEENYQNLILFIEPLILDKERVVHQGVGWFLREAWKKKPEIIEPFLFNYKNVAPRLIYQYACEKMTPEQKLKFKKSK